MTCTYIFFPQLFWLQTKTWSFFWQNCGELTSNTNVSVKKMVQNANTKHEDVIVQHGCAELVVMLAFYMHVAFPQLSIPHAVLLTR